MKPLLMKPDEIVEETFLEFNHAVAAHPDELVVLASVRDNPDEPHGPGKITVCVAPHIADLREMLDLCWVVLCFSWRGVNFEIRDGVICPLRGLPFMN